MSWRHRTYRKTYKRSQQPKFFFSEKEINFTTENLDYEQFLLQEFFTANIETRKKLSFYYIEEFGPRSFAYLERKFSDWASGRYHLTDLMRERITSIMPKFLTDTAKYKLGIHEFITIIKNTVKSFEDRRKSRVGNTINLMQLQEVTTLFKKEFERIQALTIHNCSFNVLTEDEKMEALEISKYILKIKLQNTFTQLERDFNIFLPYILKFKRGNFSAIYTITLYNLRVNITNTRISDISIPRFTVSEIEASSRFKEYSDKYLAYELVSINKEIKKTINNSFLNEKDIQLFLLQYEDLSFGENKVNMNSAFQGGAGTLMLRAQIRPFKLVKTLIFISSLKLVIYFFIITGLVSLAINYRYFLLLIFGVLFFGFSAFGFISKEIKQLKLLTKEYKTYE